GPEREQTRSAAVGDHRRRRLPHPDDNAAAAAVQHVRLHRCDADRGGCSDGWCGTAERGVDVPGGRGWGADASGDHPVGGRRVPDGDLGHHGQPQLRGGGCQGGHVPSDDAFGADVHKHCHGYLGVAAMAGTMTISVDSYAQLTPLAQRVLCWAAADRQRVRIDTQGPVPRIVIPEEIMAGKGTLLLRRAGADVLAGYVSGTNAVYAATNALGAMSRGQSVVQVCVADTNQPTFSNAVLTGYQL